MTVCGLCRDPLDTVVFDDGHLVGMVDGRPHGCDLGPVDPDPEDLGITPDRDVNGVAYLRGAA